MHLKGKPNWVLACTTDGDLYPVCLEDFSTSLTFFSTSPVKRLSIDTDVGPKILQFIVSLKESGVCSIRYIAMDRYMNDYVEGDGLSHLAMTV